MDVMRCVNRSIVYALIKISLGAVSVYIIAPHGCKHGLGIFVGGLYLAWTVDFGRIRGRLT